MTDKKKKTNVKSKTKKRIESDKKRTIFNARSSVFNTWFLAQSFLIIAKSIGEFPITWLQVSLPSVLIVLFYLPVAFSFLCSLFNRSKDNPLSDFSNEKLVDRIFYLWFFSQSILIVGRCTLIEGLSWMQVSIPSILVGMFYSGIFLSAIVLSKVNGEINGK